MPSAGREQIFFTILLFFTVVTAVTGILNLISTGTVELGDMGSGNYMQNIPGQVVPNLQTSTTGGGQGASFGSQDFTNPTGFQSNITKVSTNWISGDNWARYNGIGYEANYVSNQYPYLAEIQFTGVTPTANVYDVTYHISNPFQDAPVYFLISGAETGNHFVSGFYIKLESNSVSIVNSNAIDTPIATQPFPYANTVSTVETVFNPTGDGAVNVYLDGNLAATFDTVQFAGVNLNANTGALSNSGVYYAGVAASKAGLVVSGVDAAFTIYDEITPWSFALSQLNGLVIMGTQFLAMIGAILGLTSNAFIPFWLWAIVAMPCLATLILIYIEIARGD